MPPSRRLGLVLGITQAFAWATTFYVPAVSTAPVAEAFAASPAAILGAFSWALLVSGLCAPRVGRVIDRHGGRLVMAAGSVVAAAGLLVLAASQGLTGWYAGWTLIGLGMAGSLYDAAFATAGRILGSAARPVITGITLIGGFASTLGWPLGAFMLAHLGWRWMLVGYALLLLVFNLPLLLLLIPRTVPEAGGGGAVAGVAVPTPGFRPFAAFICLRAVVAVVISVSAPGLLAGSGLSPAEAILVASFIGPAQVGARVLQVAFGRWLDPLATVWASAILLPLAVAGLALDASPWAAAVAFVLFYGASNGILTIARGTLPLYLWGPEGYATRVGRLAMPNLLAQAAAPTLVAPLLTVLSAAQMFLLLGLVGTLAGASLLPLRRPERHLERSG